MIKQSLLLLAIWGILFAQTAQSQDAVPLFNMDEILDTSTLHPEILEDWHLVEAAVPTRQKLLTINVGQLWEGQNYRVLVRLVVPAQQKASGFHLTGGNQIDRLSKDLSISGIQKELINGGVGLVLTTVQQLKQLGQTELQTQLEERFAETLNPRYSVQYWGWPATLMRAITAAFAETDYFTSGKVFASGGSKNGASPSVAIIVDERITGLYATVSPLYDTPIRLCDEQALDRINSEDKVYTQKTGKQKTSFSTGHYGPNFYPATINAGHTMAELKEFANQMADDVFISRNWDELMARNVDMFFCPQTHDMVAYDVPMGMAQYPHIPVYLQPNGGHGKTPHPQAGNAQNLPAMLMHHFFGGEKPLLEVPQVDYLVENNELKVKIKFPTDVAVSGKIWWMHDRAYDGTIQYLDEKISDDHWKALEYNQEDKSWYATIDVEDNITTIDFFANFKKTVNYNSTNYNTFITSPYTRINLSDSIEASIKISQPSSSNIKVYPNPSSGKLFISGASAPFIYQIFCLGGKEVGNGIYNDHIDISVLEAGTYILKANYGNCTFVKS